MEFSEEEATSYVHRDKNKEVNVLEWIAHVIQEPLQVKLTTHFYHPFSMYLYIMFRAPFRLIFS